MGPPCLNDLIKRTRIAVNLQRADLARYRISPSASPYIVRQREQFLTLIEELIEVFGYGYELTAEHYIRKQKETIDILDKFYLLYRISGLSFPTFESPVENLWIITCCKEGLDIETKRPTFHDVLT